MKYLTLLIRFLPFLVQQFASRRADPTATTVDQALRPLLRNFLQASEFFELRESDWLSLFDIIFGYVRGDVKEAQVNLWWHDLNLGRKPIHRMPAGFVVHRPLRSNRIVRDEY